MNLMLHPLWLGVGCALINAVAIPGSSQPPSEQGEFDSLEVVAELPACRTLRVDSLDTALESRIEHVKFESLGKLTSLRPKIDSGKGRSRCRRTSNLPETNSLRNVTSLKRNFKRSYRSPFTGSQICSKEVPLESLKQPKMFVGNAMGGASSHTVDETATAQMETEWAVRSP